MKYPLSRVIFAIQVHKSVLPHIVAFLQRGRRGWSDSDTWHMDTYLARVIGDMTDSVRKQGTGVPYPFFEHQNGSTEWDEYLQRVSKAFKSYTDFMENPNECLSDVGNKHHGELIEEMKHLFDYYTSICG